MSPVFVSENVKAAAAGAGVGEPDAAVGYGIDAAVRRFVIRAAAVGMVQSPTLRAALRIQRTNLVKPRGSLSSTSACSSADVTQRTRPTSCMA